MPSFTRTYNQAVPEMVSVSDCSNVISFVGFVSIATFPLCNLTSSSSVFVYIGIQIRIYLTPYLRSGFFYFLVRSHSNLKLLFMSHLFYKAEIKII